MLLPAAAHLLVLPRGFQGDTGLCGVPRCVGVSLIGRVPLRFEMVVCQFVGQLGVPFYFVCRAPEKVCMAVLITLSGYPR